MNGCTPSYSPRCLVIVPVFNERDAVGKLVQRLRRSLPAFCDIVVIDDGSTDDTAAQVPPGTAVVQLPFNLGIGGAMQTGYRYAALHGYDVAVQVDGDGQHRPSEVCRLIHHLVRNNLDLVVGSRFLTPSRHYHQTLVRKGGAWFLRALIRQLTGLDITDCTSGFRAASRDVIEAFAHWYPEDYPEPEVILLLHRAGFRIEELSVRMRHRRTGQSSIGLVSGLFYVIKVTTCLLLDLVRRPWPTRSRALRSGHAAVTNRRTPAPHEELDHGDHQTTDPALDWRGPAAAGGTTPQSIQA